MTSRATAPTPCPIRPPLGDAGLSPARLLRKRSDYPFPSYPNSWYAVAWSDDVGRGHTRPVHYFGRDLVLFRGDDGVVSAVDATCPHLGAHLGAGKVVGSSLECPFHGWRFDGRGACVSIPYVEKIPKVARIAAWHVRERNGQILVWFHAEGAEPTFEVPALDGYGAPEWSKPRFHTITVRTHVQEMNENVFDLAHFVMVHHFRELPQASFRMEGAHAHVALDGVAALPGRPHARTRTENSMHGAGVTAIRVRSDVKLGPVNVPVEFMVVVGKTPIDAQHVEHRAAIVFRRNGIPLNPIIHPMIWRQVKVDIEHDSHIWENKRFLDKPVLVKREAHIHEFRQWHRQFYGEERA